MWSEEYLFPVKQYEKLGQSKSESDQFGTIFKNIFIILIGHRNW